jgi:threonine synthase
MDEGGAIHRAPDLTALRRDLFSSSVTDAQTRATIKEAWTRHRLLLEPHGAVGWRGFLDYVAVEPLNGAPAAVLETAHPAKFPEEIEKALGFTPAVPPSLAALDGRPEDYDRMAVDYEKFREYLVKAHTVPR